MTRPRGPYHHRARGADVADLKLATVYVMRSRPRYDKVIAGTGAQQEVPARETARRVNLKFAPDIRFRVDERFDEAERIEELLRTPRCKGTSHQIRTNPDDRDERKQRYRIADR